MIFDGAVERRLPFSSTMLRSRDTRGCCKSQQVVENLEAQQYVS